MPTVRRMQSRVEPQALPGVRVGTNAPDAAFGVASALDLSAPIKLVQGIVAEQRQQADQIQLQDLDNGLEAVEGTVRQKVHARKGINALGARDEARAEWEKGVAAVEASMKHASEVVKQAFRAKANQRWTRLHSGVELYTATEMDKHDDTSTTAGLSSRVRRGSEDITLAPALAGENRAIVADYGKRKGWSPEKIGEEQLRWVSGVHVGAVERMLTAGDDRAARAYYETHKADFAGADLDKLEQKLDVASTEGMALRTVDAVWQSAGPKGPNDPVLLSTMEQAIRDQYPNDPRVVKASIQELRSRATAFNAEQGERKASNAAAVLGAFNEGAGLAALVRMPEYRALDGAEQERIKNHVVDRGHALSQRNRADREERNWAAYWEHSNPDRLATLSENAIIALAPEIGPRLVTDLLEKKRAPGRFPVATIDAQQFRDIATQAGVNVIDPKTRGQKADAARLQNFVVTTISVEEQQRGRPLTREEKGTVMQKIVDTRVRERTLGGLGPERPAVLVKAGDAGKMTVAIESVPLNYRQQLGRRMQKNGRPVSDRTIADAYAAILLGDDARFERLVGAP